MNLTDILVRITIRSRFLILGQPKFLSICLFVFLVSLGGVRLSPLGTSATVGLLYQPRMIDDDCGAVGGMRIGRGNRSTRRKPASVSLCPPQIPHDLTWDRTRGAAVASQQLTAWAMARPLSTCYTHVQKPLFCSLANPKGEGRSSEMEVIFQNQLTRLYK
jgi:hypothetical protein